jgi:hypothetical protein
VAEKKALVALGLLTAAIAAYFAYRIKPVCFQPEYTHLAEERGLDGGISKEVTAER